jgi:hypothetical protein
LDRLVEALVRDLANARLQGPDAARREASIDEAAQAAVIGRIGRDHHRGSEEPVPGQSAAIRADADAAPL